MRSAVAISGKSWNWRGAVLLVVAPVAILTVACSSDTDEGAAASQPTVVSADETSAQAADESTAVPTQEAASTDSAPATDSETSPEPTSADAPAPSEDEAPDAGPPAAGVAPQIVLPDGCAPGASTEDQKAKLVEIAQAVFPGENNEQRPRLQFEPEARDHRRGGIWLVAEFNGDEFETILEKKISLDTHMRVAYQALFTSGCDELNWVDITAIAKALTQPGYYGKVVSTPVVVFKTRMKMEVAETVDWSNAKTLDFNEIWDNLLLNPSWAKELRELEQESQ
jgi:hypothetical protein